MSDVKESTNCGDAGTQVTTKGGKRSGTRLSSLEKIKEEAERILKGFNHNDDVPEGRRTTRSSSRSLAATPPPVKKERRCVEEKQEEKTPEETVAEEKEGENGKNVETSVTNVFDEIESKTAVPAVEIDEKNLNGTEENSKEEVAKDDGGEVAECEPSSVDEIIPESDTAGSTDDKNAESNNDETHEGPA